MDPELKELLKRNIEVSEESLKILKKINRDVIWRRFFGILKLAVAAGVLVWSYLWFEPYLAKFSGLFQSLPQMQGINLENLPPEIKKFLTPNL